MSSFVSDTYLGNARAILHAYERVSDQAGPHNRIRHGRAAAAGLRFGDDAGGDPWGRPRAGALRSGADGDPEFMDPASGTRAGHVGGAAECAWPERVSEADENDVRSAIEAEGVG